MKPPIRRNTSVIGVSITILLACSTDRAAEDGRLSNSAVAPLKVLILTGGDGHDWRTDSLILRRILADTGRFDVRVCESPGGLTARTLAEFDVLVHNFAGPLSDETEKDIARFVESGKGLVITHGALAAPPGHPLQSHAIPEFWPLCANRAGESPVRFQQLRIVRPDHPVVRGVPDSLRTADAVPLELKTGLASEVIATARRDSKNGNDGRDEPVVAASGVGAGRALAIALGHDASAMYEPAFKSILARGTEWATTGNVTLPADLGLPRPAADSVRGVVITGGHDHETGFYSLFDDDKDMGWLPVMTSATAFKSDLRKKYDVVIMYDFTRELDEAGKKNLRDFVENGGGVVVLHHALLNFQKWTWWSEEVVGGRYRLQREGSAPSSGVKDDQQIFVTPAAEHPVTAGIGPFHITDEAYNKLYMSPRVRPLINTDNSTSDTNLAWLGPNDRYRVVAIQLGHGHTAHQHPAYRKLVHNAVLWAANKSR
jgi:type 1 glutamine amidotransferase